MFRQLLRRFLLPQLLLIGTLAGLIVVVAAIELGQMGGDDDAFARRLLPIVWVAIGASLCAALISWWMAHRFATGHLGDIAHLFASAVPLAATRRPNLTDGDQETILHDIARTFSELMDDASKDQAQLMTIIAGMSDGLIATDHQQRILLTNDAARELMVFRTPEAAGKQLWEVVPLEMVLKAVTEVSLTGQPKTVSVGPVNSRYLDVSVTRLPLRPAGFIIVAHDVTETMRYEELRKEFVANVSHELRTPLTVIKGYVETLKDGAIDDRPRAMQYLGTVEKHTEQLTNLVNDLLSLSRLDSSATVPNPRPVHLGNVAAKVADLMNPTAAKKGHKLLIKIADGLHPVIGNPEYLERAVSNLVENAIKYTRDNGLIQLVTRGENGQVIVEVIDNGLGISAEDLPRIFERFYRADRSRSRDMGGTGLGLSIVKHIVQAHGGQIEVLSVPGTGSTFRLRFPMPQTDEMPEIDASGASV